MFRDVKTLFARGQLARYIFFTLCLWVPSIMAILVIVNFNGPSEFANKIVMIVGLLSFPFFVMSNLENNALMIALFTQESRKESKGVEAIETSLMTALLWSVAGIIGGFVNLRQLHHRWKKISDEARRGIVPRGFHTNMPLK